MAPPATWFPNTRAPSDAWRLDAVVLLAVIGDASIRYHVQTMTATWLCLIPRLIPAPQALLTFHRLSRLPATPATVIGTKSGILVRDLNFYGNLIHSLDRLGRYEFRQYEIGRNRPAPEEGVANLAQVEIRLRSPVVVVTLSSVLLTWTLVFLAFFKFHDGVAALAIIVLAFQTSIVSAALWWRPGLAKRASTAEVPKGDVVIRTREGAFVYVQCEDEIARELYVGTDILQYHVSSDITSDTLMTIGTVMIMAGVVLLGNSTWSMQLSIGIGFVLLNLIYWFLATSRPEKNWNLQQSYSGIIKLKDTKWEPNSDKKESVEPNFTLTLWYTIFKTQTTDWVVPSGAIPYTDYWTAWLKEASDQLKKTKDWKKWDAVDRKDKLMAMAMKGVPLTAASGQAASHAQSETNPDRASHPTTVGTPIPPAPVQENHSAG